MKDRNRQNSFGAPRGGAGISLLGRTPLIVVAIVLALVAAACGGGASNGASETTTTQGATTSTAQGSDSTTPATTEPETTQPETEELTTVRFGTAASAGLIAIWLAYEQGYFLDHGLDIQMEEFNTGGEVTQAIAAGHIDAGIANLSNSVPIAVAGGTPLRGTITTTADPSWIALASRFAVMARVDSGVTPENPEAMRGMNVGLQVGGTPDIYFRNYLESIGLTTNDVNIQNIPVTELGVALEQGIVEVGVTWDPMILRNLNQLGDQVVLLQEGGPFASDLGTWVATDALIDEQPEVVKAMLRAIIEAKLLLESDPNAGVEPAMKYIDGLTEEEALYSINKTSNDPRVSVCIEEDMRRAQAELIEDGRLQLGEPLPTEAIFTADLLRSVLAEYEEELQVFGELPERIEDCTGY